MSDDDELFGLKSSRTGEYLHSKSADEMFEKLGYTIVIGVLGQGNYIKYNKDDDNVYYFFKDTKEFYKSGEYDGMCGHITMQELQAINKKCYELGWLDE
jgi:hypothetical protein